MKIQSPAAVPACLLTENDVTLPLDWEVAGVARYERLIATLPANYLSLEVFSQP